MMKKKFLKLFVVSLAFLVSYALPIELPVDNAYSVYAFGDDPEWKRLADQGDKFFEKGAFHAASTIYQQACDLKPEDWQLRLRVGKAYARIGRDDQAIAELFQSLVLNQKNPAQNIDSRAEIACLLMKKGNFDEAGGQLKQVLEFRPDDDVVRGNYAICLDRLGFVDLAIGELRIIVKNNPASDVAFYNLGYTLLRKGDFKLAAACFQKSLTIKPSNATAYVGLARALMGLDKDRLAVGVLRKALEVDPYCLFAYLALADAYEQLGNKNSAIEAYKKAIQINPKDPMTKAALAKLLDNSKKIAVQSELTTTR